MDEELSVDDLLKQRRICRSAITKMFNQMNTGVLPEIDKVLSLKSDHDDIVVELLDHNHVDNADYSDKIESMFRFMTLYVNIDTKLSSNSLPYTTIKHCQTLFNELNKMIDIFPGMSTVILNIQSKLESSEIQSPSFNIHEESNESFRTSTPMNNLGPVNVGSNIPSQAIPSEGISHNVQPLPQVMPVTTNQYPPINNVLNHGQPMKIKAEDMPKFNGSAIQWPEFKDAALELIVNNTLIPTARSKFRRLFNALPLEAQSRIRDQRENPNFSTIFSILEKFYGSPAIIIKELTSKIFSLPFLRLDASPTIYTKYYDLLLNVRSVKLNEGDARTILSHVLHKMDVEHRRRAFQQADNSNDQEYLTLANVEEYFRKITTTDMLINQVATNSAINKINRPVETRKALVTSSSFETKLTCIFCHQSHRHSMCPTSVNDKYEVLRKEKRCFKCAGKGHGTRECMKNYTCFKCKGNHVSFLCRSGQNTTASTSSSSVDSSSASVAIASSSSSLGTSQSATSSNPSTETNIENQSVNTALAKTGGSSQYLQTLTTKINNIKTRVIFDGGSELSFISNKLVKLLNLPKFKTVPIRINGYGGNPGRLIGHHFTIIKLPDRDGNITEFKLIIDDTVCHFKFNVLPTMIQSYVNKVFNIDFNDENIPTDILFGNSDINRLKVLAMDKNFGSLIIGKTSLGYIVHGQTDDAQSMVVGCLTENHDLPIDSMINPEDDKAMREFVTNFVNNNLIYNDIGKIYEIKFPIINNNDINPNFNNAKRMLLSKVSSMRDSDYSEYNDLIQDLVKDNIVQPTEIIPNSGYHMPHNVVSRKATSEKTTTKKRLVFNASNGINSLNQALFKGVTTWSLPKSLLQFRLKQIALVADIKAAFHCVYIQKDHQKYVKFLWKENNQLVCYKFLRLPFGLTSSPFLLNIVINHHIEKYVREFPEIVSGIQSSLYVDDLVSSVNTIQEAIDFHEVSTNIFKEASMVLRKWQCSDPQLDKQWSDGLGESKVLGIIWNKIDDNIQIVIPSIDLSADITKRYLLGIIGSVYDPMGLILPTVLRLKFFISDLWTRKIDWDDVLTPKLHGNAVTILNEIKELKNIKLSRKLFNSPSSNYDLIIFCDASNIAIGVAVYLSNGSEARYIYGKSKLLKPRKTVTGELLALSKGASIGNAFKSMIQINKTILVSDSKVNVQRLTNDINKYPQCVAVHLYNIRNKIDAIHWVAGKRNPSDFLTRGASPEQLMNIQVLDIELLQEIYRETNRCSSLIINISNKIQSDIIINQSLTYEQWIDLAKQHISRITDQSLDPLTMLIRLNQQYFIDEINKFPNVYLDDNCVIRCNTRLDNSDLDFDCKNPIFIPKSSFLEALVTKIHQNIGHGSLYRTMCEFRETYFTPKLRQIIKKMINKCPICQTIRAKPLEAFLGTPPASRVTRSVPFR
ncbi:hypothetical protein DERP_007692 [Dermatophagoides pteronyssinus]|uniref:CCHC-type domain-containing protein n=1 Tax=Dermatophagoides pteronyssinus TaxID=6956 RepID=A0ABQ8JKG5_DERPT|nr:hypothetical protein DERP_007692 [Dermatophagoides pteronyssinus]